MASAVEMMSRQGERLSRQGRVLRERSVSLFTSRKAATDMFVQMRLSRSSSARWEAMHACMALLWHQRDVAAAVERIYRLEPDLLHAVLPQCLHYILHAPHTAAARSLERFLLRACGESTQLAFELYWLLLAQPSPVVAPSPATPTVQRRSASSASLSTLGPVAEPSEPGHSRAGSFGNAALVSASTQSGKAVRIDRLLQRVRAVVEQPKLAPVLLSDGQLAGGTSSGGAFSGGGGGVGGDGPRRDLMGHQLRLIHTLTAISDKLRSIDRAQRNQRLRSALHAVNRSLPPPPPPPHLARGGASGGAPLKTGALVDAAGGAPSAAAEGGGEPRDAAEEAAADEEARGDGASDPTANGAPPAACEEGGGADGGGGAAAGGGWLTSGGGWRPFVPLVASFEPPHHLLRFVESEAFVLSTKERVPYLVFAEVIRSEKPATSAWSAGKEIVAAAGRVVDAAADRSEFVATVQDKFNRLSRQVKGRALSFSRGRNFSFERMGNRPRASSERRSCAAVCTSDPHSDCNSDSEGGNSATDIPNSATDGSNPMEMTNHAVSYAADRRQSDPLPDEGGVLGAAVLALGVERQPRPTATARSEPNSISKASRLSHSPAAAEHACAKLDVSVTFSGVADRRAAPHEREAALPLVSDPDEIASPGAEGVYGSPADSPYVLPAPPPMPPMSPMSKANAPAPPMRTASSSLGHMQYNARLLDHCGTELSDGAMEPALMVDHELTDDENAIDYTNKDGFGELWQERAARLRLASVYGSRPGWRLMAMIVKAHDDLLQEQFAVQLIFDFQRLFRHSKLPLRLRPYRILATSPTSGLIEVVPDAKSLDSLKKSAPNCHSLAELFKRRYGGLHTPSFYRARRNFVQSLAAYSVVCYLLQIKDRHNGNILLHANGSMIHIDFGFLLSNSPGKNLGFEAAPFKLTAEWVEVMGGPGSAWFSYFRALIVRGFLEARRHKDKLLQTVRATYIGVGGALPCFRAGEATIDAMAQRFQPAMSKDQYARFADSLVAQSFNNWRTRTYDCYQKCCLGIL